MRLQKYISHAGITSRRNAEQMILRGRVKVNDKVIKKLGTIVEPGDIVMVDNKKIELDDKKIYIMLNKPEGYVTTLKDEHSEKIVLDLIDGIDERIYPVGRLDKDSTGLILLTNDGNLAHKLTHPSYEIWKKYIAIVEGFPNDKDLKKLRKGVKIDNKVTSKSYVKLLKKNQNSSTLEISIHEGRNRQIRKMCEYIRHPVLKLKRVSIEDLELGELEDGKWRYLSDKEIKYLKKL